jgi:hypothetical protein
MSCCMGSLNACSWRGNAVTLSCLMPRAYGFAYSSRYATSRFAPSVVTALSATQVGLVNFRTNALNHHALADEQITRPLFGIGTSGRTMDR